MRLIVERLARVAHVQRLRVVVVLDAWQRRHCVAFGGGVELPLKLLVAALVVDVAAASDGVNWAVGSLQR